MNIQIYRNVVRDLLFAESTNASRTYTRNDGVSDFEKIVIDQRADKSLEGAWNEACAKLEEKMHEFLNDTTVNSTSATFDFTATQLPNGLSENIKMFIVNFMMADWMASVRPDFKQRYVDRCAVQMDDLMRKLYKKEPPV